LFSIAGINLITKQVATVSGVAFTLVFFSIFLISERINERKRGQAAHVEMDQFRLQPQEIISNETVKVRPGNALCLGATTTRWPMSKKRWKRPHREA
jgi:hypothetical protein